METQKIISQLATLTEQTRWISQDLHEIKKDIKNLNAFKFKVIGMAVFAVTIIEIARAGIIK